MPAPKPGQKTVLITGCTPGGIGHGLCVAYQRAGLHVIATARRPEVLLGMAAQGMTTLTLDVTSEESIKSCRDEVSALTNGKLDILVNNAGRTHTHPATDLDLDDVRTTFETNVFGTMAMVKYFVPLLIPAKGLIINTASLSAVTPYVFGSAYSGTKGAVTSYSRTLRLELAPFGVRVMVTMTGTIKSNTTTHGHRTLPPGSLYERVRELFEWRLNFSQQNQTMDTDVYATRLVARSLAPERTGWVRGLLGWGRPDWFWFGGLSRLVWWGHTLGEWFVDGTSYRKFGMDKLEAVLKREEAEKKQL